MKKSLLAVILVLSTSTVAAAFQLKTAVVKVSSSSLDGSLNFNGSGLAFKIDSAAFVLTSDHVLLHDNQSRKHQILFPDARVADAEFITADFGRGLALVKITSAIDLATLPTLQDLSATGALQAQSTVLMGYPAMSRGLIRDQRGHVTNPALASNALIQNPSLIEVSGAHGEFGMSGGVAATPDDHFLGVLSHQIYDEASTTNLVLAIPAQAAVSWAQAVATTKGDGFPIQLAQTTDQLLWKESLTFSSHYLSFVWMDPTSSGVFGFSVYSSPSISSPELIGGPTSAFASIEEDLKKTDCVANLNGFREAVPFGRGVSMSREPHEIMRLFERPHTEPVFRMSCNETADAISKLNDFAKALRPLQANLATAGANTLSFVVSNIIRMIEDPSNVSRTNFEFYQLKRSDIDSVLTSKSYASDWQIAQRLGFEKPLRGQLLQLRDLFAYLTE